MAAQVLRKGQAIVWVPPRALGERAFATEACLLALLPIGVGEKLVGGGGVAAAVSGSPGAARYMRLSLDALPTLRSVTLVFDARDVTLLRVKLPPLSGARLRQALPNVVEDMLLQDAQQCGFALGPRSGDGERLVAAIDRSWLELVIGTFERRGAKVQAAWPAQLAVPPGPSGAALACVNDGLALRIGPVDGLGWQAGSETAERAEAIEALIAAAWPEPAADASAAISDELAAPTTASDAPAVRDSTASTSGARRPASPEGAGAPQAIAGHGPAQEPVAAGGPRRLPVHVEGADWHEAVKVATARVGVMAELHALPVPVPAPVDLLAARQGNAARRWLADIDWREWRVPAALAAGAAVVALLGLNLQWGMLAGERDALRAAIEARYRQAFPEVQVIVDPVLQMERQVADMRARAGQSAPEDFVPLLTRFAQALGSGANDALAGVEYRDGRLRVRFQAGQFEGRALRESLVQACQRLGLQLRFDGDREPTATVAMLR